jgi:glycosyltransferase involved in cell wall biosynthesis
MNRAKKIYIISYFNLTEKLAGGLRANELYKFLKSKRIDTYLITRKKSVGYETIVEDFEIPNKLRKLFHVIFPDSSITWVWKLFIYFKDKKNVILIVTTPPHGLIYLRYLLRDNKSIKFIHDFRDPFTLNAHPQKNIFLRKFLNKSIEKNMVHNVDHIVFNTDEHRKLFIKEYGDGFRSSVIKNGYIHSDFSKRISKKELVYFGGHYSGKVVDVLLKFITMLNVKASTKYVLDVYGEYHQDYDIYNEVFNYCGLKKRAELANILLDYKIGIVCYTEYFNGRGIATKFYEILGLGITPYCINPSNDLINLLEELDLGGYCFIQDIENLDITFFEDFEPAAFNDDMLIKIKKYSRDYQNNLFVDVINNL